ncbi:hypothetical protein OBBRIDRAFT_790007 [Obba rivulosa]|uniref:Uncharacterized protein n=1 Tax=Obba rivulosa TaxID=1052685 RepID=A0A8E2J338_9APHY|nr:hypothetical protein OBBRIDRAFT_790007 [Obba rivulosa]
MAVLSLPLTFQNSFWTQDYRKGLEVLYSQLEQGLIENDEVIAFIRARAIAESALSTSLTSALSKGAAFERDDGASLHLAFRGLKEESIAQGRAHEAVANELHTKVADPFEQWASGFKERLRTSRHNVLDGWMHSYEMALDEVARLKADYLNKTRKADEAEDDARFAPIPQPVGDPYTTSPNLAPRDKRAPVRQPTISERITSRLKELRLGNAQPPVEVGKSEVQFDADVEEKPTPRVDKGKGRAVEDGITASPKSVLASPPPLSPPLPPPPVKPTTPARLSTNPVPPPPIDIAGVLLPPAEVSALLLRAKSELPLRPIRFPLLGEYQDCFSGEEFATWLKDNVQGFEGDLDRAEVAARILTEKLNVLRRLGEFGNDFENADDAFYQFRQKAFELEATAVKPEAQMLSPLQKNISPLAENAAKGATSFANLVTKAFANNSGEPAHIRARREADVADKEYRVAVRKLDRQRLGLEERIEETLKTLQKWEMDRLRAIKTVMRQYHDAVSGISKALSESIERSATLNASYQPEADMRMFIERHRTGPFRPTAQVYESVAHDECDVVFGIDLRRWSDSGYWNPADDEKREEKKEEVPPVLTALLTGLKEVYPKIPTPIERRKTWVYDVPLPAVHHLREALNAVPENRPFTQEMLAKYDAPVLASAVKLWMLELDPPLGMYEGWDELRRLYPTVGSSASAEAAPSEEQHIQDLQAALQKLPKVHLAVLDTIVTHLKELIDSTTEAEGEESNEVYVNKLALSLGRNILRPKQETEFSIQDRHPTLLFIDLITKYDAILPPTIAKKKRESERRVPVRRRTRPVDMRMSRSRISAGADLKELHAQQLAQRGIRINTPPPTINVAAPAVLPSVVETRSTIPEVQLTAEPEGAGNLPPPPPPAVVLESAPVPQAPPPPPVHVEAPTPPAPAPPAASEPDVPRPPTFKEPPPEDDDLPPRPTFKEPSPESESLEVERPSFKEPPPEPALPEIPRPPTFREPPPEVDDAVVTPPPTAVPAKLRAGRGSISRPTSPRTPSNPGSAKGSRSPSPTKPASPSPTTAAAPDGARLSRGPRLARGPRAPGGGSVSSMVSNLNRQSVGARPGSPGTNGSGGGANLSRVGSRTVGGHGKRGSVSRVSEFSRRTIASDAEDEILDK